MSFTQKIVMHKKVWYDASCVADFASSIDGMVLNLHFSAVYTVRKIVSMFGLP